MPIVRLGSLLSSTHVALTFKHAFVRMPMLAAAVDKSRSQQQRPLTTVRPSSVNVIPPPKKRKFDRTMSNTSSLAALSQHVQFDENDFDDSIDLTASPPPKQDVRYPQLDNIQYPELPPAPSNVPPSSTAVPWSSSPPSHYEKPRPDISPDRTQPMKRRKLPWDTLAAQSGSQSQQKGSSFTPLPKGGNMPWNKTDSAVKDEKKEFRNRFRKDATNQNSKTVTKQLSHNQPKPIAEITEVSMSAEQKTVIDVVVEKSESVFFTGSAGTGKSVLMRTIISKFKHKFRKETDRLAITASTGLAACVIEGQTLHSWAGIGLGKEPVPELVKKIKRNAKTKQKWLRTKVLVVDEISMVDGELFDKLEAIARALRNNGRPFGGIQLVVTGDFFQLPPVPDRNTVAKFAFDAGTWKTCIAHTILLTHVFRQKDPAFANMLNEMRLGKLSPATIANFRNMQRPLKFEDDVEATELFPTRNEVDNANIGRMQMLSGQTMEFPAVDSGVHDLTIRNKLLANFMAPEKLTLKKGAQVMLIKNIDTSLVNGSLGKIQSFMDESTFHVYKDDEETFLRAQEPGEDPEGSAAARAKINQMRYKNGGEVPRYWPMVRFHMPDGSYRELLCQPEEWKVENQNGEITAKRVQVPLILAWALSIHKAQGQTLSRVKVDLGKVFERGQAYVALSRATEQKGLQVLRFDQKKVMVHPKVIEFYNKLASADTMSGKKKRVQSFADDDDEDELEAMYA